MSRNKKNDLTETYSYLIGKTVGSPHHKTKQTLGRLLAQELEVEVKAAKQASKAQGKLLVQVLKPADTTLEVDVEALEQGSKNLVIALTAAQAGLRPILQN